MGEIRIVGPGKTRGYPYPVCKKNKTVTALLNAPVVYFICTLLKQAWLKSSISATTNIFLINSDSTIFPFFTSLLKRVNSSRKESASLGANSLLDEWTPF